MGTEMTQDGAGEVLWNPPADARESTRMGRYLTWLEQERGLQFDDYAALWRWSVDDLEAFWATVWDYFGVISHTPYDSVMGRKEMPGTEWFPGATLNYAEHALRAPDEHLAIIAHSQTRDVVEMTYAQLRDQVARARTGLLRLGVAKGDRVAAYMPNIPETIVAALAVNSIGAIWSSCAPEFGTRSVVDRLQQVDPKVLLTIDGYRYGAKDIDRASEVAAIRAALPSLEVVVSLPYLTPDEPGRIPDAETWAELTATAGPLEFEPVPFDHPQAILFSSGTTGLPKPIVHGHGGVLLEHFKSGGLHMDLGPEDRFFWFTTTGWVMWNILISGLIVDGTVVLFDGNLAHPDTLELWRLAESAKVTFFGVSAPYLLTCRKEELHPARELDLSALKAVGSTGAPLPPEGFRWVYDELGDDVFLVSISGGTDIASAFVGGTKLLPVWSGEIACAHLGIEAKAFDAEGNAVVDGLGELVITTPMPSMPVGFWNDPGGERFRESYFDTFEGIWRHGDWIRFTERGSCLITGRSDATLNRGGVRLGTSEFYSTVEALDEVADSLVVHLEDDQGGAGELLLFVQTADGVEFDDELAKKIKTELRTSLSPRHVPDTLVAMPSVPRTLTGKKLEVPVKRILRGAAADDVSSKGALSDPEALKAYEDLASDRGAS